MAASALLLEFVVCFFVSLYLLHKYGDVRRQNVFSSLATFVAWYVSFLLVFTLPIDIASTYYNQCVRDNARTSMSIVEPNQTARSISNASILTTTLPTSLLSLTSSSLTTSRSIPNSNDLSPSDSTLPSPGVDDVASSTSSLPSSSHPPPSTIDCHKSWTYSPPTTLMNIFRLVYWTSQLLTWIVLPLMQSYAWAGDFSIAGKLRSAIIYNAIYYGSYLLIFGVLLIYVASRNHLTAADLKVICITASNTWGLFLLVLLLGYGLVEIPRVLWNSCNRNLALAQTHFKIAKLSTDKSEAEEEMEDCLEEVRRAAETITYNHPHRRFIEIILSKCPEATRENIRPCTMDDFQDYEEDGVPKQRMDVPSEKTLVRLHVRVIRAMQAYNRTQAQWEMLIDRALALEDEVRNIAATHRSFTKSSATAKGDTTSSNFGFFSRVFDSIIYTPTVEWYWRCLIRPNLLRLVALCFAVLSIMVVWSEVTFFVRSPVLSLFAVFLQSASVSNSGMVVFLSGVTISYLCLCAYYTIFRIKIFNYYYIASDHLTDENSLLFIGALLCRLTPPLCLNFLGLVHLDSHVTENKNKSDPSYSAIMGHLSVIPLIEDGFNIYFPILVVVLCLATHFHVGSRCLAFLGFQQFIGDDEMTQDYIDDGRNLLNREKRHRERAGGSSSRRYRLGAYRPAASSERDSLDLRGGVESRSSGVTSGGVVSGGAFASRSRGVKSNDGVDSLGDGDDFLGSLASAESPVSLTGGGEGGGRGRSGGVGYQSGLPSSRGKTGRTNIRGIFDDV